MRIVIDMQGAQTESRFRGIGRYTISFAQAIVRNRGEHEVFLALSGLFPDTIEPIRAAFDALMPQENIRVWHAPGPVMEAQPGNNARREVAELVREAFLASLAPDVIHISSLFEGYGDNAVTSIGRFDRNTPVSVSLYDLIPLLNPDQYLKPNPHYEQFYLRKIEHLKKATICLAISEIAAQEATIGLALAESSIVNLVPTIDLRKHYAAEHLAQYTEDDTFISAVSACDSDFWNQCATNAIAAFVPFADHRKNSPSLLTAAQRPLLAFVSPLPPERTGIADYSAELLPALAKYYDIEIVVAQNRVDNPWINSHAKVRDVNWLRANAANIDRVLYHIGNSHFHKHMVQLLREIPGVVVLHDFFIGHLKLSMGHDISPHFWTKSLYSAHSYNAVCNRYLNPEATKFEYPVNLDIFQHAKGLIVHSEYARELAQQWYGNSFSDVCDVIPLLRTPAGEIDKTAARKLLDIDENDTVVCSFGLLGTTKLNHRLLESWLNSSLAENDHCRLIFVGENHCEDYGARLSKIISSSGLGDRIRITGYASPEIFRLHFMAADIAVQLRTQSRGETSAAALDCMNHALPLIVNANGSMAELDTDAVWMLPDEFNDAALIEALETLWREPERRRALAERAREIILDRHAPDKCAECYVEAIERFHRRAETAMPALLRAIAEQEQFVSDDAELISLAKSLSSTLPLRHPAKRLFLDVTATCHTDLKTGIERVARALLLALLEAPPAGYRIEPVYLSNAGGVWHYRYARRYTLGVLGCPSRVLDDEIVEVACGDVLLGLDLSGDILVQADHARLFVDFRNRGVRVYPIVFDLLPVQMPERFPPGADRIHMRWLQTISKFDGAICISKTVADDFAAWQVEAGFDWKNRRPFRIGWFHLGADFDNSAPTSGLPNNAEWALCQFRARPSFLMVGTIEPRKGYLQAIEAFSQLWNEGVEANLIIVGKEGWKDLSDDIRRDIPETIKRLRNHPKLDKRLFWLEGISDEYLEKVYAASSCLIAASHGEGFGLPLIEAAQHTLPIIARNIPVFREVAGDHAFFFSGTSAADLAQSLIEWLQLHEASQHPTSDNIPWLKWKKSAVQLMQIVLGGNMESCGGSAI